MDETVGLGGGTESGYSADEEEAVVERLEVCGYIEDHRPSPARESVPPEAQGRVPAHPALSSD